MATAEFTLLGRHASESAVWAWLFAANAVVSAALAVVLLARRGSDMLSSRAAVWAAAFAVAGVLLFLVPYAQSMWSSATSGAVSAGYVALFSAQVLSMLIGWCMMPAGLIVAISYAAPGSRGAPRRWPPLLLAVSLAGCASLALAGQRWAQIGYVAYPGIDVISVALWRDGWLLIAAQAVVFLLSAGMFGWAAWRIRMGQSGQPVVCIAAALVVGALLGAHVLEKLRDGFLSNMEGTFGWTLAVLRDLLFPLPMLAPLLPALTWPVARRPTLRDVVGPEPLPTEVERLPTA